MGKIAERFRTRKTKFHDSGQLFDFNQPTISGSWIKPIQAESLPPERDPAFKGKKNGKCNVTACVTGLKATWYNKVMDAYYCPHCAQLINWSPLEDGTYLCRQWNAMLGNEIC